LVPELLLLVATLIEALSVGNSSFRGTGTALRISNSFSDGNSFSGPVTSSGDKTPKPGGGLTALTLTFVPLVTVVVESKLRF